MCCLSRRLLEVERALLQCDGLVRQELQGEVSCIGPRGDRPQQVNSRAFRAAVGRATWPMLWMTVGATDTEAYLAMARVQLSVDRRSTDTRAIGFNGRSEGASLPSAPRTKPTCSDLFIEGVSMRIAPVGCVVLVNRAHGLDGRQPRDAWHEQGRLDHQGSAVLLQPRPLRGRDPSGQRAFKAHGPGDVDGMARRTRPEPRPILPGRPVRIRQWHAVR